MAAVVAVHADVVVREGLPARGDLPHDRVGVLEVEERQAPHLPVDVPGMGIVRVLDGDRPALVQAVLHLGLDGIVVQVRKVREGALGQAHRSGLRQKLGVATTSGVSVDSNSKLTSCQISSAFRGAGEKRAAPARMSGPSTRKSRPSLRAWIIASSATRLAVAPWAIPSGCPIVPPPNCSTQSSPR